MITNTSIVSNIYKKSKDIHYIVGDDILIGNTAPIGTGGIDQSINNVQFDNIQDAIDDLKSIVPVDIGSVQINTTGLSPSGSQQVDNISFSGTVNNPNKKNGDDVVLMFYGIPVNVVIGDTSDQVANQVTLKCREYLVKNRIFADIKPDPTSGSIIQIRWIDYKPHKLTKYTTQGITVTQDLQSPAKSGYGVWERIGKQELTLGETKETLHYFKRVG